MLMLCSVRVPPSCLCKRTRFAFITLHHCLDSSHREAITYQENWELIFVWWRAALELKKWANFFLMLYVIYIFLFIFLYLYINISCLYFRILVLTRVHTTTVSGKYHNCTEILFSNNVSQTKQLNNVSLVS